MDGTVHRGGNLYDKYGTKNPVALRLMQRFLSDFDDLVAMVAAATVLDVGCGEGHLAVRLADRGLTVRGCDPDPTVVTEANARLTAFGHAPSCFVASIEQIPLSDVGADLVVCCEVLEHVADPELALDRLISLTRSYLLLSVPREPVWRALNLMRGAYIRDLGNTPGHVNHWSSRRFIALAGARAGILAVRRPLPWTMLLCQKLTLS